MSPKALVFEDHNREDVVRGLNSKVLVMHA